MTFEKFTGVWAANAAADGEVGQDAGVALRDLDRCSDVSADPEPAPSTSSPVSFRRRLEDLAKLEFEFEARSLVLSRDRR